MSKQTHHTSPLTDDILKRGLALRRNADDSWALGLAKAVARRVETECYQRYGDTALAKIMLRPAMLHVHRLMARDHGGELATPDPADAELESVGIGTNQPALLKVGRAILNLNLQIGSSWNEQRGREIESYLREKGESVQSFTALQKSYGKVMKAFDAANPTA